MASDLYFGFSSTNVKSGFDTTLKGIELVKRDLLNHFNTPQYAMVGRPSHYCLIPSLLFKKDERTQQLVAQEAQRVFREDPRVQMLQLDVSQNEQTIFVIAKLLFVQFNMEDYFFTTFGGTR